MSSNISSNTLFHFTNKADNLIGILENEFHPKFCLEEFVIKDQNDDVKDKEHEIAIPMVCFCDLPLSQVGNHLLFYGSYGIGMKKEWGKRNGLNPVFYVTNESAALVNFQKVFQFLFETLAPQNTNPVVYHPQSNSLEFASYFKPYEGPMWRNNQYVEKRFYDEREWRYIPSMQRLLASNVKVPCRLFKEEYMNPISLAQANSSVGRQALLKFEPNDIKYIIVSKESEINAMIDSIKAIKQRYSEPTKELLASRVISAEQILEDF